MKTSFKSAVSGTALMETLSPTGMEEMVTVYSLAGDGIALIHFCPTDNQPRMRVVPASGDPKELVFDLVSAGHLKSPGTGHQHHLVIAFEGANHVTETWTWREGGMDMPTTFHFGAEEMIGAWRTADVRVNRDRKPDLRAGIRGKTRPPGGASPSPTIREKQSWG